MDINGLREIGKCLMKDISGMRQSPDMKKSIGYGASGDRTFPVDKRAEDIIIDGLKSMKEPLTIVSEEIGVLEINGGGKRVIIDPIDGSRNAVSGIPFYCTSIAVADGETLDDVNISYVINLGNGDEFWAERASGAFLNGRRIQAQQEDDFYMVAYETQVPGRYLPMIIPLLSVSQKTRCFGAIALDLSYLACGSMSVFVSPSLSRSFDFAGGWLLVREAGGVITDTEGRDIGDTRLDLKRRSSLVAAGNRHLHRKAIELIIRK